MDDMAVDSDEEVDYSKMDQVGCHKLRPDSELGRYHCRPRWSHGRESRLM